MTGRFSLIPILILTMACRNEPDPDETGDPWTEDDTGVEEEPEGETVYTIEEDVTWAEDITIGGVWYVAEGATLTILEGVNVKFLPSAGLVVDGVILTQGTAENPVRFYDSSSLSGANYGVSVGGTGDQSVLSYSAFEGVGLRIEGAASTGITGATFADATLSLYSRDAPFAVDSCSFTDNERDNQTALLSRGVPQVTVVNSVFDGTGNAIQFDGVRDDATLEVSDSTFNNVYRAALVGSIGEYAHRATFSNVQVTRAATQAIAVYRTNATMTGVTVNNTLSHGIYGDPSSHINISDSSITNSGNICLHALGSLEASGLTVSTCESSGIYGGEDGATLTGVTVTGTEAYGIYSGGEMSVSDSVVTDARNHGIYGAYGDLTVENVEVRDVLGSAIYAFRGNLTASHVTVQTVEGHGVYVHSRDLTISESTISDVRTNAIYAYRGDIYVLPDGDGVSITNIDSSAIYANDGNITAENVTIEGIRNHAIYAYFGNATVYDTSINDVLGNGIYAYRGNMTAGSPSAPVSIENIDGIGLYAYNGTLTADTVSILNPRSYGVYGAYGDMTLNAVDVVSPGTHGIYNQYGTFTATSVEVIEPLHAGIYVYVGDNAVMDDITVRDAGTEGVYAYRTPLTLSNANISGSDLRGVYGYGVDISVSDAIVSNSLDRGIYVYNGDAILERVQIIDETSGAEPAAGSHGVDVRGYLLASELTVDGATNHGVYTESGDIAYATLANNGDRGILFYGNDPSTLVYSDITDNGSYGVQGTTTGDNLTDIAYNNITGNQFYGAYYVRLVDSCYIADNDDEVGADLTEDGALDGELDTRGTQVYNVDAVTNPQSSAVSGTGA
ncbi:MAG: right-handed parallel beta-helix repeat-containing protein [Alphaproteobacteria bacterium]|nr:right-handed parallel beta-helix repeat-containing protein [Alphaproteobacteria bacterium]